jgi:multidrug efflux pump subunit AcrA (membrane-fusion protein)
MKIVKILRLLVATNVLFLTSCSIVNGLKPPVDETTNPPLVQAYAGVIAEGRIVPLDSAYLFFSGSGKIANILVVEGQTVVKEQTLAWLDNRPQLDAKVSEVELGLLNAQQTLGDLKEKNALLASQYRVKLAEAEKAYLDAQEAKDKLDTQDTQDQIDNAWEDVISAEDDLKNAQDDFDRYKNLDVENYSRKNAQNALDDAQDTYDKVLRDYKRLVNNLEKVRGNYEQAELTWNDIQQEYANRQNGPDPDELALAEAQLAAAEAQLAAAKDMVSTLELKAPFDGTIVEIYQAEGEVASPGQPVFLLADFSEWFVETTDLTEIEVVKLTENEKASIIPDSLGDISLTATIQSISQVYKERSGDIVYKVRLLLSDPDPRLRWGMTVEVRFSEP